LYTVVAGPH